MSMDVNPISGGGSLRTSFIPKAGLSSVPQKKEGSSFLTFLAITVLFVSALGWLAAYGYKSLVAKDVATLEASITKARESFDPNLLKVFENLDRRLNAAEDLLKEHTTIPPLFALLDEITLKTVRYSFFTYANNGSAATVRMSGEATSFQSIALLALEFSRSGKIQNPIFSNLGVESKEGAPDRVTFEVAFNIDPALVAYVTPVTGVLDGI
jgi:hypothetical protein